MADATFVARMDDDLDVDARLLDPDRPLVCFDEGSNELHGETRTPPPAIPSSLVRVDT